MLSLPEIVTYYPAPLRSFSRFIIRGAFHCYIRFPNLLYQTGLSGHREEKILIQLDTEAQHFNFESQRHILNKFDVFTNYLKQVRL